MKAVFGVAGAVVPGELEPLRKLFAARGASVQVITVPGLELLLVARSARDLDEWYVQEAGRHAIAVGRPLHPLTRGGRDTMQGTLAEYGPAGPRLTRSWYGEFNLLIVDEPGRKLELETDCLGLRPMFIHEAGSRVVFGSEVWPLAEAGLVPPVIDPEALAAWVLLEHPLNGHSLISGVRRIPPGRARIDLDSGSLEQEADLWNDRDSTVDRADLARNIADSVDDFLARLIREEPRIGAFLSGGYDSRYLACRLAALGHTPEPAILVDANTGDVDPARAVASRLDIPLTIRSVEGSLYDEFADPWFFAPHGFPIRQFYTRLAIESVDIVPPMVDGLLGDDGVRGWIYEQGIRERSPDPSDLSIGLLKSHLSLRPEAIFGDTPARQLRRRVLAQIDSFRPDVSSETRRAWLWVLLHRTRDFHAKNHLQVLDQTETYHPFVNPELIRTRMNHSAELFDEELYTSMFGLNCPGLEGIPHSDEIPTTGIAHLRFSRVFRARLPAILAMLVSDGGRMGINRLHVAPRLTAYALGHRHQLYLVKPLDRIRVLGERVQGIGGDLPWEDTLG